MTAEEAKIMRPWVNLAGHLGSFIGQMTDEPLDAINILYDGTVSKMNLEALNLYATQIGDNGLEGLELLQKLNRIYIWSTQVTPKKVENLKAKRPDLEINLGEVAS